MFTQVLVQKLHAWRLTKPRTFEKFIENILEVTLESEKVTIVITSPLPVSESIGEINTTGCSADYVATIDMGKPKPITIKLTQQYCSDFDEGRILIYHEVLNKKRRWHTLFQIDHRVTVLKENFPDARIMFLNPTRGDSAYLEKELHEIRQKAHCYNFEPTNR